MSAISEVEKAVGHVFADPSLLRRALTHASVPGGGGDNERLEFLGDRVLGLVVADLLYHAHPDDSEGPLSRRHAALVERAALARAARGIDLGAHIRLSAGEARSGGAERDNILADACEALIGAVYLDAGFAAAGSAVAKLLGALSDGEAPSDPKTALQEWAQGQGFAVPDYKVVSREGPEHAPVFTVEARAGDLEPAAASAASKRGAEKLAAALLLARTREGGS